MCSASDSSFGVSVFDCTIRVECQHPETCRLLYRTLYPPLPRSAAISVGSDIEICLEETSGGFRVLLNREHVASASTPRDAVLAVVKALDDVLVSQLKGFRAVHAGAVLIDGRALLLPGSSHAGKSSLVAELLRRGAAYFSDEYALIDLRGMVHSYPRPLLLRNGSPRQSLVHPEELNATIVADPAPVGWIIAVDYVPDELWNIGRISQAEALMLLLSNTPHEMSEHPEMVDSFLRIAETADCYQGTRGDVVDAASQIFELVRRK